MRQWPYLIRVLWWVSSLLMENNTGAFSKKDIEIIDELELYNGFTSLKEFHLKHRLFSGGWSATIRRELVLRGAAAGLLPYDPDRDEVVLIEQFRIGAMEDQNGPWILELIAGILEEGEDIKGLARREAEEEAGLQVAELHDICEYFVSPGASNEKITLFCCKVDSSKAGGIHGLQEEGEDIRVKVLAFEDAMDGIRSGLINNAASIIALQWLAMNKDVFD